MAEIVGLTASIIQIVGASAKLSTSLYQFAGSAARADQEIADIAGDVEITANALESVGKVFENENAQSIISKRAVQDANNLIKRCEAVFEEISEIVDKRRKIRKDGKKSLSALGKFSWPMKEQRVELLRRRLESLKNNLVLLLHVIQLANGQAKGCVFSYLLHNILFNSCIGNWKKVRLKRSIRRFVNFINASRSRLKALKS
jgi:hypothetical protein